MALTDKLTAIANAIREKTGNTGSLTLDQMPIEIAGIETGGGGSGTVEPLDVTENGTYTPPEGVDGYSPVNVMVAPPASDIDKLIDRSITDITSGAEKIGDYAFANCVNFKTATFPNATTIGNRAFYTDLYARSKWTGNFPKVETIGEYAFANSSANGHMLEKAYFPKVNKIGAYAFYKDVFLNEVYFPEAESIGGYAFGSNQGTNEILVLDFPKVKTIGSSSFSGCGKATTLNLPSLQSVPEQAFYGCLSLKSIEIYIKARFLSWTFKDCYSLVSIVLRSEEVCQMVYNDALYNCYHFYGTVNSTYNPDGLKDGYIYVPRALVEDYKAATNWSNFADRFRALEDYTVDGTITGALDETKI